MYVLKEKKIRWNFVKKKKEKEKRKKGVDSFGLSFRF